jgi:hypothetical protein
MEDDLNLSAKRRQPQFVGKWKTASIFLEMTDDLNLLANGRQSPFSANKRQPHFLGEMEFDLDFVLIEMGPQFLSFVKLA